MRKSLYVGAAAITIVAAVIIWQRAQAAGDEAPIRVRGGSIEIETDGEWTDGNDAWVNQTSGGGSNELWVKVTSSTGTCRAVGRPVRVQYSQPNVHVTFNRRGFWSNKTIVTPKNSVALVDRQHLRAGTSGDGGRITEVRAQNLTCSIAEGSANLEINICSSRTAAACQ